MPRRSFIWMLFVLVLFSAAAYALVQAKASAKVAGAAAPTWAAIEVQVRKTWAERYATEKIVTVARIGEPSFNDEPGKTETMTTSSSEFDWSDWSFHDNSWSTTIKGREGSYLRQRVDVTVLRANQTKAVFHLAALYKLVGKSWTFAEMPVGQVEELAGAGSAAQPTDAEAAKIFAAAWASVRPDFNVSGVKVTGKEFHQYKANQWITYKLEVKATGTAKASSKFKGKAVVCKPQDFSSQLKLDKAKSVWAADESSIQTINEDGVCEEE